MHTTSGQQILPWEVFVAGDWRGRLPKNSVTKHFENFKESILSLNCPERHIFHIFLNDFAPQPTCFLNSYLAGRSLLGLKTSILSAKATFENGALVLWSFRHFFKITLNFMLVQSPVQQGMHPRTRPIIMTTFREWQIRRKPTSNPTADIAMLLSLPSVEAHNSAHSNSPSCWVDLTSFAEHCTSSIPDRKAKASRGIAAVRL